MSDSGDLKVEWQVPEEYSSREIWGSTMAEENEIFDAMVEVELSLKYQCYPQALKLLREILASHPDCLPAKETLEKVYRRTAKFDLAEAVAKEIILLRKKISEQPKALEKPAVTGGQAEKRLQVERIDAIIREIYDCSSLRQILEVSSSQLLGHLRSDRCLIILRSRASRDTKTHEYCRKDVSSCLEPRTDQMNQFFLQRVAGTLNVLAFDEALKSPELADFRPTLIAHQIQSVIAYPLIYKTSVMGLVILHRCKRPGQWCEQEKTMFSTVTSHMAVALGNVEQLNQVQTMAFTDKLTGIYNRRFLEEKLTAELRNAQQQKYPVSFAILDVDLFKKVNDTYGHAVGDKVLQKLAYLLKTHFRKGDTVARFGGEEFAVILPNTPLDIAHRVLENTRKLVEREVTVEPGTPITISAGVTTVQWRENDLLEEIPNQLILTADEQLYRAKRSGRNMICSSFNAANPSNEGPTLDLLSDQHFEGDFPDSDDSPSFGPGYTGA